MKIVEHFVSIQGEGAFAGRLAVFIRFAGCNLRCAGFGVRLKAPNGKELIGCDTIKASQSEHFGDLLKDIDFKGLCEIVDRTPQAMVVLTGGEPLLYQKNADFKEFINYLVLQNRLVQFESNGTIEPDFFGIPALKSAHFALSIKLANSGESKEKRINAKAIKSIFANANAFYKFVLSGDEKELDEIRQILQIQKGQTWLMPLGATQKELEITAPKVAKLAIENGFNYSDRIHIRLWNSKEGV